jgi:hypothetical protein
MADTDLAICNRALVELGHGTITAIAGTATAQVLATQHYEKTVKQLLGAYRWNFARRTVELTRQGSAPTGSKWTAAYDLPTGWLVTHQVQIDGTTIAWEAGEAAILCDAVEADNVYMEFSYRVDTDDFPEYFIRHLECELMAKWAFALTGQETVTAEAKRMARVAKTEARTMDAQSSTTRKLPVSRFMQKRVGQGGYRS